MILLIQVSQVARVTGRSHQHPAPFAYIKVKILIEHCNGYVESQSLNFREETKVRKINLGVIIMY
jgi:hypothetical protein